MTLIKTLLSLSIIVLLAACSNASTPKKMLVEQKNSTQEKQTIVKKEPLKTVQEVTKEIVKLSSPAIPNIAGTYNLVKGAYIYNNGSLALQNTIEASSIVVEKLDENDFGYYYVTQVEGLKTEGYFGGFTYKDGHFYQKVIDYPTTNTTLRDNIHLESTEDSLKLTVKTINAKRVIHWKKNDTYTKSIETALKQEKRDYLELFKDRLFPEKQHISMK